MKSVAVSFDHAALQSQLLQGAAQLEVAFDAQSASRLIHYLQVLARWNATYNLTAVRNPAEMVTRHLLDSLSIARFVTGKTLIDLGSGAGLPGIPLAVLDPQRKVTLVDSNGKKASFLREAARQLALTNVDVEQARAETLRGAFDCVVARAFASIADFIAVGGHLLSPDGVCLAMKGAVQPEEIAGLPPGFVVRDVVPLHVPGLGAARHIVIIHRS